MGGAAGRGGQAADPETAVVARSGDGGCMYKVQELTTAVLHKVALVTGVFTDGAFGNVLRMQRENYGGKVIASNLHNPDFVKLAENFGAAVVRAHGPDELRVAIREGLKREGPTLVEVPVGEMAEPWKLFFFPRARWK